MAAHLYIHALYEVYTYSNLISAACTSSIHCVRTTHDPGYVVWFIRPVIIRVKGNYPCATSAAIFDPQNPCNCGGVFTLSMRHVASQPRTSDRLACHWRALYLLAYDNWRCSIPPEILSLIKNAEPEPGFDLGSTAGASSTLTTRLHVLYTCMQHES